MPVSEAWPKHGGQEKILKEAMMKSCEIEKKYKIKDPREMRQRLLKLGAKKKQSGREVNQFWDMDETLEDRKMTLRLRKQGSKSHLTLKGPRQPQGRGVDKRLELEMPIDFEVTHRMLKMIGFKLWLSYIKTRELYALGKVIVTLDNLGRYGWFLEIEGGMRNILAAEKRLGLLAADVEPRSYLAIVLKKKRF